MKFRRARAGRTCERAVSSVGRAPVLHTGCHRFEPCTAHQQCRVEARRCLRGDTRHAPSRYVLGVVVQLVRTLACHARGRGFESRRPRQLPSLRFGSVGRLAVLRHAAAPCGPGYRARVPSTPPTSLAALRVCWPEHRQPRTSAHAHAHAHGTQHQHRAPPLSTAHSAPRTKRRLRGAPGCHSPAATTRRQSTARNSTSPPTERYSLFRQARDQLNRRETRGPRERA